MFTRAVFIRKCIFPIRNNLKIKLVFDPLSPDDGDQGSSTPADLTNLYQPPEVWLKPIVTVEVESTISTGCAAEKKSFVLVECTGKVV